MDDLISRQAAIDAVELITWYHQNRNGVMVEGANDQEHQAWYKAEDVYKVLYELPSTQPNLQPTCNQLATDCISRQAAIDALASYIHNVDKVYSVGKLSADDCKDAAKSVLDELPSAQQWIPCSERLPEREKDVLVTRDYDGRADGIKSCRYVEVASCYGEDGDITWNSFSDEYKMRPRNHHVVAWMPLPEPYKGNEDDGVN